ELYLKIGDYSGSLRYFNWFKKTFPDDVGYPDFLFEWTITLYKTKRIKEAEKKAIETFSGNSYLFDSYFGKPVIPIEKWEFSNFETKESTIRQNNIDFFIIIWFVIQLYSKINNVFR